jgi:hypothetical protein
LFHTLALLFFFVLLEIVTTTPPGPIGAVVAGLTLQTREIPVTMHLSVGPNWLRTRITNHVFTYFLGAEFFYLVARKSTLLATTLTFLSGILTAFVYVHVTKIFNNRFEQQR